MARFDPTGLVYTSARAATIAEDSFQYGTAGWTQLFTPDNVRTGTDSLGRRVVSPLNRINRGGTSRLALFSPAIADTLSAPVQCMGIKRMNNAYGDGRYLLEMIVSLEWKYSNYSDRPLDFGWGLDMCDDAGARSFFKIRYQNYSAESATRTNKWQVKTGLGYLDANYTDIPGGGTGVYDALQNTNENKALPVYIALLVNTANRTYEGVRVGNWIKAGLLADTPNNDLISLGAMPTEAFPTFKSGLNSAFDIRNPAAGTKVQEQSNLHYHRLTYLGA
jgi:hypothetical protein